MARQNYWANSDGLAVGFGTHTVDRNVPGKTNTRGVQQEIVLAIHGSDVPDVTPTGLTIVNSPIIPTDSLLLSATLFVTTTFVGATATLDIGTYNPITAAITDDDGVDVAIAVATLVDNAVVACDGAQIGTVLTAPAVIYASYDTAAFTAGQATLVVRYIPKIV